MNNLLPKARTSGIIEQEAGDELLIYDLRINKAYTLNETSKNVYLACGRQMTFEGLRSRYQFTDDLIYLALDELKANNLIEDYSSNHFAGMNRREVVRRVGLSTMIALPVIVGLIAPKATSAASGLRTNGQSCNNSNQCTSNRCGTNGFGPSCCLSNDQGSCATSQDCCSGVVCTNGVCCQNSGRTCDTRQNPSPCCAGLTCVAPNGTNGTCQSIRP